jgi:hypothetical protein
MTSLEAVGVGQKFVMETAKERRSVCWKVGVLCWRGACGSYWSGVRNGNLDLSKKWHRGDLPRRARVEGRERVRDHRDVFALCCRRS